MADFAAEAERDRRVPTDRLRVGRYRYDPERPGWLSAVGNPADSGAVSAWLADPRHFGGVLVAREGLRRALELGGAARVEPGRARRLRSDAALLEDALAGLPKDTLAPYVERWRASRELDYCYQVIFDLRAATSGRRPGT